MRSPDDSGVIERGSEQIEDDGLLGVEPVLGLVEHDARRDIEHAVRDLLAAVREPSSHSRHGAITPSSGASAAYVSSNRTWSLPLPVAPWATPSAPSRRAISTWARAMSGRAIDVPRR